jgi:hypothetical protein
MPVNQEQKRDIARSPHRSRFLMRIESRQCHCAQGGVLRFGQREVPDDKEPAIQRVEMFRLDVLDYLEDGFLQIGVDGNCVLAEVIEEIRNKALLGRPFFLEGIAHKWNRNGGT